MSSHEVTVSVPREQIEAAIESMLKLTEEQFLSAIADQFMPSREAIEERLQRMRTQAPMQFLIPIQLMDHEGRVIAHVGPLESDLEGHVAHQMDHEMHAMASLLRETFARALKRGKTSVAEIMKYLLASPLCTPGRDALLRRGLEAWSAGDHIVALPVLIPQVEHALRQLSRLAGAPLYRPREDGGFNARMLGDLLRDLSDALGPELTTYFTVLLTDARGWNLRNDVCHGLAAPGAFNPATSDRVVHALLLLASLRPQQPAQAASAPATADHGAEAGGPPAQSNNDAALDEG